ncbi:MAG TPA: hypothetical protein VF604_03045 [Pyrinomonadaceae bacterium]|jgi:hypothetical protein
MIVYAILVIAFIGLSALVFFRLSGTKGNQSAEDAERFAKLLITEIKLYNDYKIRRGLENHNLYAVLRDEIGEAAKMYRKRVQNAEYFQYFNDALINILADGDKSRLGAEFNQTLE